MIRMAATLKDLLKVTRDVNDMIKKYDPSDGDKPIMNYPDRDRPRITAAFLLRAIEYLTPRIAVACISNRLHVLDNELLKYLYSLLSLRIIPIVDDKATDVITDLLNLFIRTVESFFNARRQFIESLNIPVECCTLLNGIVPIKRQMFDEVYVETNRFVAHISNLRNSIEMRNLAYTMNTILARQANSLPVVSNPAIATGSYGNTNTGALANRNNLLRGSVNSINTLLPHGSPPRTNSRRRSEETINSVNSTNARVNHGSPPINTHAIKKENSFYSVVNNNYINSSASSRTALMAVNNAKARYAASFEASSPRSSSPRSSSIVATAGLSDNIKTGAYAKSNRRPVATAGLPTTATAGVGSNTSNPSFLSININAMMDAYAASISVPWGFGSVKKGIIDGIKPLANAVYTAIKLTYNINGDPTKSESDKFVQCKKLRDSIERLLNYNVTMIGTVRFILNRKVSKKETKPEYNILSDALRTYNMFVEFIDNNNQQYAVAYCTLFIKLCNEVIDGYLHYNPRGGKRKTRRKNRNGRKATRKV